MPYSIMALMATFRPLDGVLVTSMASVMPSILAKFSTVVNPVLCFQQPGEPQSEGQKHLNPRTQLSGSFPIYNYASFSSSQPQILSSSRTSVLTHNDCHTLVVHYNP
ncbi:hypothetical protein PAMA_017189 [Pampus argenteus]